MLVTEKVPYSSSLSRIFVDLVPFDLHYGDKFFF